jgi:hypothetical protein
MPSQRHAVKAIPAVWPSIRQNHLKTHSQPAAQRAHHTQAQVTAGVGRSASGTVRQDRHLWNNRRTAVPYAQYEMTIPPAWHNCQVTFQPFGPTRPWQVHDLQNVHRTMLASCWRLERGSAGVPNSARRHSSAYPASMIQLAPAGRSPNPRVAMFARYSFCRV